MEEFKSILLETLNTKRDPRKLAEQRLEFLIKQNPTETFLSLASLISSNSETLATLSSVLIYNKYITQGIIKLIDSSISQNAFDLFTSQLAKNISVKTCNKIGQILAGLSIIDNKEVEFLAYVVNCCQNPSNEVKNFGFYLFVVACEHPSLLRIIQQQVNFLTILISENIVNQDLSHSVIICLFSILKQIPLVHCQPLEACFFKSLEIILSQPSMQLILGLLEVTEKNPQIWTGKEIKLMFLISSLVRKTEVGKEIRVNVVEVLRTYLNLVNQDNQADGFWQECVSLGFVLLAEPDYCVDIEQWASYESEDLVVSIFKAGFDLLRDVKLFPVCQKLIQQLVNAHLNANYWVQKNAGITASQLLNDSDTSIILSISDSNPRLSWSILDYLSSIVMEKDSQHLYEIILQFTLRTLNNSYSTEVIALKLQVKSLIVIENLFTKCSFLSIDLSQGVIQLLPEIYQSVFRALANSNTLLAGLKALASLIETNGEYFSQVSSQFLNGLTIILNSPATNLKQQEIRAACINCWCAIVEVVQEFTSFTDLFSQIWKIKQGMDESDIGLSAIWYLIPELHKRLKERFSDYLQTVISELINRVKTDIDIHITENEIPIEGYQCITVDIPGRGEKIITMNLNALETKIEASEILYKLVDYYPPTLTPYFPLLLQTYSSLISFEFSKDLRIISLKTLSTLPKIDNSDNTLVTVSHIVLERLTKLKKTEEIFIVLKYFYKFLKHFTNVSAIGLSVASLLCKQLALFLDNFLIGNSPLIAEQVAFITEIVCLLMKSFRDKFKPLFFQELQTIFAKLLYDCMLDSEILLSALCIYCDFVEFTGDLLVSNGTCPLLEQFIKLCYHESPDIRQTAATAIVKCLDKEPNIVQSHLNEVKSALIHLIELPNSKDLFIQGSEAAVAGIVKISILFQPELLSTCLNWIPLNTDAEEATEIHRLLINNHKLIPNHQYLMQSLKSSPYLDEPSRYFLSTN